MCVSRLCTLRVDTATFTLTATHAPPPRSNPQEALMRAAAAARRTAGAAAVSAAAAAARVTCAPPAGRSAVAAALANVAAATAAASTWAALRPPHRRTLATARKSTEGAATATGPTAARDAIADGPRRTQRVWVCNTDSKGGRYTSVNLPADSTVDDLVAAALQTRQLSADAAEAVVLARATNASGRPSAADELAATPLENIDRLSAAGVGDGAFVLLFPPVTSPFRQEPPPSFVGA